MFAAAGKCAGAKVAPEISYITSASSTSDLTTYTFSSVSFGNANDTRRIFVCLTTQGGGSGTVTSLTVGGVSAEKLYGEPSAAIRMEVWVAAVPTGTTGNIVVNWSTTKSYTDIHVYRAINLLTNTPTSTIFVSTTSNPVSLAMDLAVNDPGFVLSSVMTRANVDVTWTNATEGADAFYDGGVRHATASQNIIPTSSTYTVTAAGGNSQPAYGVSFYYN
jgi:hypothetical protein